LGKLRVATERMAREIREVRRDPGGYAITTMTASDLVFTKADGTRVTLKSSPPQITLAYDSPAGAHTLCDQVGSAGFQYLQADGSTAATGPGDVKFVVIQVVLTANGNNYPQRTRVALRNSS
ncbi:MAG TPA: hypothetical protein VKA14_06075, partial [Gammaproteobacteria bacterium]|nr:hypothetical protein [Gammaproteobacteria bacterium]